jgi:hypothetical protein
MSNISVNASASRSGIITLNAQNGTLTLPAGTLNTNGASGQGAGSITLLANTINTADGTILAASQDSMATGTYHGVIIAAQTINVTGASGLQVHADGNGVSGVPSASVYLAPEGSVSLSSNGDPYSLLWNTDVSNVFYTNSGMTVGGSSAPITVSANGNDAAVFVSGNPITFSNGAVTLQSNGNVNNQVYIGYYGTFTGTAGLAFSGSGDVNISANGVSGGNGGTLQIYTDQASISSPSFTVTANADSSGGSGGSVTFQPTQATIASTTAFKANGASGGAGNGGTLTFYMTEASISGPSFTLQAET